MTESKSSELGSPLRPWRKFWHRLQSLRWYLPREQLRPSALLLSSLSVLCPSCPTSSLGTVASTEAAPLFRASERLPCATTFSAGPELSRRAYIWYDTAFGVIAAPKGQSEPSLLPAPEACSPLPKHCIRAQSVRSIWKRAEAASTYVCQRTRTHPVWKREERPSAFHRELVTVADSPCRFGYCMLRCAQLRSVLQSHLLAERITVLQKG